MGNCCASTTAKAPPHYSHSATNSKQRITAPPLSHPLLEEETVKEVLSETPTLLPKPSHHHNDGDLNKPAAVTDFKNPGELSDDFSASDICSTLSDSTVPTTTLTNKIDGTLQFKGRRESSFSSSPSRRFEPPSLGRGRSGTGSNRDSSRRSPVNRPRKENYENAGRRSVSPAMRTENGGARTGLVRSPSVRKTGKSPGRVRSDVGDKNRKMEKSCRHKDIKENWQLSTNSNELLENPLVSLECFIFL